MFSSYMKRTVMSLLLLMTGILCAPAQGLDANVKQRLETFFTR